MEPIRKAFFLDLSEFRLSTLGRPTPKNAKTSRNHKQCQKCIMHRRVFMQTIRKAHFLDLF